MANKKQNENNRKTLLRLVQAIPGSKAEKFKGQALPL